VVEIQQTFYKLPRLDTVQRWRQQAPPGFEFVVKAWQLITHPSSSPTYRQPGLLLDGPLEAYGSFQANRYVLDAWTRTRDVALALKASMVLFQCPPGLEPNAASVTNLVRFFSQLDRGGLTLAWEARGDWPVKLVQRLCQELKLVYAVDPFAQSDPCGGTAYFRLNGKTGFGYRFTERDLSTLLKWCGGRPEAYCLFSNVSMWEDALRFNAMAADDGTTAAA
jgi:uncharacterized protein YecE (DUF72 family)